MDDSGSYTLEGSTIEQSICPAGWTLPLIDVSLENTFNALWDEYGFSDASYIDSDEDGEWDSNEPALWTSPLYFAASGRAEGDPPYHIGSIGTFWTPVLVNGSEALLAHFDVNGSFQPGDYDYYRHYGYSVRCLAR